MMLPRRSYFKLGVLGSIPGNGNVPTVDVRRADNNMPSIGASTSVAAGDSLVYIVVWQFASLENEAMN